jgi:hypothetical protein
MEKWAYNFFVLCMCLLMGSGYGHEERRVGIYREKSRKTDHIVQKAVVIRIHLTWFILVHHTSNYIQDSNHHPM